MERKVKYFIALGCALTSGCESWTANNFASAKKAGASPAELSEVVQIAMIGAANKIRTLAEKQGITVSDTPPQMAETKLAGAAEVDNSTAGCITWGVPTAQSEPQADISPPSLPEAKFVADRDALDAQQAWWDKALSQNPSMFGNEPSEPAKKAAALFQKEGVHTVLELGAGTGRDTKLFGVSGFQVCAVDYSRDALETLAKKAKNLGLSDNIETLQHDIRQPLPFPDSSFDACYSHMLFCMALTEEELSFLAQEVRRVLKPGGLCVYTARHTGDSHYGAGIPRGEGMYELNGFVVHFFDRAKVERLAKGYEILDVAKFEEGALPRRLFQVVQRKTT